MNLKFRKKPVVIEAFRMTKEHRTSNADWPNWMHEAWMFYRGAPGSLYPTEEGTSDGTLSIGTLEGQHLVSWGDFIIQGVRGELYPCKPDIFWETYEMEPPAALEAARYAAAEAAYAYTAFDADAYAADARARADADKSFGAKPNEGE